MTTTVYDEALPGDAFFSNLYSQDCIDEEGCSATFAAIKHYIYQIGRAAEGKPTPMAYRDNLHPAGLAGSEAPDFDEGDLYAFQKDIDAEGCGPVFSEMIKLQAEARGEL